MNVTVNQTATMLYQRWRKARRNRLAGVGKKDVVKSGKTFEFYIPVIVVQGKLFECFLDQNDNEVINEIQEGQLLNKSNVFPNVFPVIEIITRVRVSDLANKIRNNLWSIFNTYFEQTKNLIDNFPTEGPSVW